MLGGHAIDEEPAVTESRDGPAGLSGGDSHPAYRQTIPGHDGGIDSET
ncbi:Uncharacterised protein [Mycobacteroides abscessus subsp. massiliense]|nr:Uncharacterised protein [Mycobacteroides abscessus subsp. massiliense]